MKVDFQLVGEVEQDQVELREYTLHKVSAALKSSRRHIREVVVQVNNTRRYQHESGKKCSVLLFITGQNPIRVKKHADNILSAINSAIEAASYKTQIRTRQREILAA